MAITQALCNSFKQELLVGTHDFTASTGDTFKIALYTNTASLDQDTTVYTTTAEASGTGYTAGGATLTSVTPVVDNDVAVCDFSDAAWTSASFTARGAVIYNSSQSNKAVAVLDFGGDFTVAAGTFTLQFPSAAGSTAIIRIS